MTYSYGCKDCRKEFDVIKSVRNIDDIECCPGCGSDKTERYISRTSFYGAGGWDSAEYNPAFGKVIRNPQHRAAEAKARGWEEIGNEDPDKIHKADEAREDKMIEDSWSKV